MPTENSDSFTVFNETPLRIPTKLFKTIYTDLYHDKGPLTLILTTDAVTETLNRKHRKATYPAEVLTFPAEKDEQIPEQNPAEIFISVDRAKARAQEAETTLYEQLVFLFLHGILHLLGYKHGEEMEQLEDKYATRYR